MILFHNASWPKGLWNIVYVKDSDRYIIRTSYNVFIAEVGPTLVAHWIVDTYNFYHKLLVGD